MWSFSLGHPMALGIPLGTHTVASTQGRVWPNLGYQTTALLLSGFPPREGKIETNNLLLNRQHYSHPHIPAFDPNSPSGRSPEPDSLGHPVAPDSITVLSFPRPQSATCSHSGGQPGHILVLAENQQWGKRTCPVTSRNQVKGLDISARHWITSRGYSTVDSLQLL